MADTSQTPNTKALNQLLTDFTYVKPVNAVKDSQVSTQIITSCKRINYKEQLEAEYSWMKNAKTMFNDSNYSAQDNISWAAYHAATYLQKSQKLHSPLFCLYFMKVHIPLP